MQPVQPEALCDAAARRRRRPSPLAATRGVGSAAAAAAQQFLWHAAGAAQRGGHRRRHPAGCRRDARGREPVRDGCCDQLYGVRCLAHHPLTCVCAACTAGQLPTLLTLHAPSLSDHEQAAAALSGIAPRGRREAPWAAAGRGARARCRRRARRHVATRKPAAARRGRRAPRSPHSAAPPRDTRRPRMGSAARRRLRGANALGFRRTSLAPLSHNHNL